MAKYRKKPVVIEAMQWGDNISELTSFLSLSDRIMKFTNSVLEIDTLEGTMIARKGDWIIKGVKGEFYPCKPDIFKQTYEEVKEGK